MTELVTTRLGRLRILSYMEGLSLLILLFVAVPVKHFADDPSWVKILGPIHGALFLLFVFNTLMVGIEKRWKFAHTTWKVLLACIIPFGTFYIDEKVLKPAAGNIVSN